MNRLHKKISLSLLQKLYIVLFFFVLYGWYKNGLLPYFNHFYPLSHVFLLLLYPTCGWGIGALFDIVFKNKSSFNNKFYGFLFSLIIPISTNIYLFIITITFLLFLNTFLITKKDWDFNFIVFGKIILILILMAFHNYQYGNLLEESNLFVYSYLDSIFGNQVSGLFTSNVFLTIASFSILCFDLYYKKEIPFYGFSVYVLTLVLYSFYKSDMQFLLHYLFSSDVLFSLVFIAPLSSFSPYSNKRMVVYSIILGLTILPFSLLSNFHEGIYISLLLANSFILFLNVVQMHMIRMKIK